MIIFDTETTGIVQPVATPIDKQPQIIEFAAIKLSEELEEVGRLEFMCNPGKPLPDKIVEITKIKDADLRDKKPFVAHYGELVEFFLGERVLVAHNLAFDRDLLGFELERCELSRRFPWPPEHKCTVELTYGLNGYRLNLGKLYELATGKIIENAHRAMSDVEALVTIVRWLRTNKGVI